MNDFTNHVAHYWTADMGGRIERVVFRQPGSSNRHIEFLSYRGILVVTGDLYDAIYEVYTPATLTWWTGCDADYVGKKMRGPNGYSEERKVWDHEAAQKDLDHLYKELVEEARRDVTDCPEKDGPEWDAWLNKLDDDNEPSNEERPLKMWRELNPRDYTGDKQEWEQFCRDHAEEIWGQDWYETQAATLGMIQNPIVAVHLEALGLALAQLKEKGIKVCETAEATKW